MDEKPWKEIRSVSGMTHAKLITGRLAAEGIATRLKYEAAGVIYAITVDGLGEVRILVPEEEWDRAREILAEQFEEKDFDWEDRS
ncbi:MAG: DUF2007 domain-containing protein [Syntrophales bacterium]|nr:DUF2007 domain-containing protein [Syntrophales bacterium]